MTKELDWSPDGVQFWGAIDVLDWAAQQYRKVFEGTIESEWPNTKARTTREAENAITKASEALMNAYVGFCSNERGV